MKLRAEHPATVNRLAPFEVGTTAAMLKFVTNEQLRVDAGACIGSAYSIDPGLDGEGTVSNRIQVRPLFASKNGSDAISMMFTVIQVAPINLA
jgi:hypothetical protein